MAALNKLSKFIKKYQDVDYDQAQSREELNRAIDEDQHKIVVLDDDPTGVQTVHDVYVYTDWSKECIRDGFLASQKVFFILTNSRAFTKAQTEKIHREIARNILAVSAETGIDFILVSRSDSTLRGHYPLEMDILAEELQKAGKHLDGEILIPFFQEGGRYTIEDVHYVDYDGLLVPSGETEFAKDKTFGYQHSDLKEYIAEKSGGKITAAKVTGIPLSLLRRNDRDQIDQLLTAGEGYRRIIVNAIDYDDVMIFCLALYRRLKKGGSYIFRTAASFVKVAGGIGSIPCLSAEQLISPESGKGGLIIVGSHTAKTTKQLEILKERGGFQELELRTELVLADRLDQEAERVTALAQAAIAAGQNVLVYTSRTLIAVPADTKEEALMRSVKISAAVQSVVAGLTVAPRYVVAKGGITASDIGVKALRVKKALVMGQIKPGIPVWLTGPESRFPGMPYIIFPGNVGQDETMREVAEILQ